MEMSTELGILLAYAIGIFILYVIGYLFLVPIKFLVRLTINSLLGGVFILLVNWMGGSFGVHIPLNFFTAVLVGILGLPGAILLLFL